MCMVFLSLTFQYSEILNFRLEAVQRIGNSCLFISWTVIRSRPRCAIVRRIELCGLGDTISDLKSEYYHIKGKQLSKILQSR